MPIACIDIYTTDEAIRRFLEGPSSYRHLDRGWAQYDSLLSPDPARRSLYTELFLQAMWRVNDVLYEAKLVPHTYRRADDHRNVLWLQIVSLTNFVALRHHEKGLLQCLEERVPPLDLKVSGLRTTSSKEPEELTFRGSFVDLMLAYYNLHFSAATMGDLHFFWREYARDLKKLDPPGGASIAMVSAPPWFCKCTSDGVRRPHFHDELQCGTCFATKPSLETAAAPGFIVVDIHGNEIES